MSKPLPIEGFGNWPYDPPREEMRDRRKYHKVDHITAEK
jgi:hypothetical protein